MRYENSLIKNPQKLRCKRLPLWCDLTKKDGFYKCDDILEEIALVEYSYKEQG
jgi:hypothetical protein